MSVPFALDIAGLLSGYRDGTRTPGQVIEAVIAGTADDPHHAWIHRIEPDALRTRAAELERRGPHGLALYGVPFAVKDNIDVAGVPTTAGCPDFAYLPQRHAFVVQRLVDAGAIVVGKTNLDQFATGLNGTRSPYGACTNAFDPQRISGGSSSGSAVAVALGQVSFALGTDTAGSGRVPAAFNHLVGLKPTCGLLSTQGVVPACRSLDTPSIFALTADDARRVFEVARAFDPDDAYSRRAQPQHAGSHAPVRPRLGVPRAAQLRFFQDGYAQAFTQAVEHARGIGAEIVEIDLEPFLEAARLLYEGPWVAERYQAIRDFIERQPGSLFHVTREITLGGARPSAADAFAAMYRLKALQRASEAAWERVDALLLPTVPAHPTIEAMLQEPVRRNSELGLYTNFMNLLDCSGVAVPAGFLEDGLPFGVTLAAPAHRDGALLALARRWQHALSGRAATMGATGRLLAPMAMPAPEAAGDPSRIAVAVCGAHLQGQPLNHQLTDRGARLQASTCTAPTYRLYELAGGPVRRPGLVRTADGHQGAAIEVEVWDLPVEHFGSFVAGIPAPLGIGRTVLADGRSVPGFICEPAGLVGARDITEFGGWRAWLAAGGA